MKYSQFNSIISYENKFVLYNTFEKKFIFLDPELKNILIRETQDGIDNLINIHPDFYNYLIKNNFLIKDDIDEVEEVKKIVSDIDENRNMYYLTINPIINCNLKCWYCYETHIKQSKMNVDIISNIINNFVSVMKNFDKQFTIGFTTNGYLINDKFINFLNEKQLKAHFHITLDGYRENHDKVRFVNKKKGSYCTIINNIKKLVENEMFVRVRINFTEENIEDTYKIADDLLSIEKEMAKK